MDSRPEQRISFLSVFIYDSLYFSSDFTYGCVWHANLASSQVIFLAYATHFLFFLTDNEPGLSAPVDALLMNSAMSLLASTARNDEHTASQCCVQRAKISLLIPQ